MHKYCVFKWEDFEKHVPKSLKGQVLTALDHINRGRYEEGKEINEYIVINKDETYIAEVTDILKDNNQWEGE